MTINSFWILGSALILAALSYYHWQASVQQRSLRQHIAQSDFSFFFWVGLVLISIGLAGTSQRTWEIVLWIIFALLTAVNAFQERPKSQE